MSDKQNIVDMVPDQLNGFDTGIYSIMGTRDHQQDYAGIIGKRKGLAGIICDGMGGLKGGELASSISVNSFVSDYMEMMEGEAVQDFLLREADKMDELIFQLADSDGNNLKAGSTVASVIIEDLNLYWFSVGDSRIYILRNNSILQITRDHNYRMQLNELLKRGEISEERYETESSGRQAEALVSHLGMGGLKYIDRNTKPFPLEPDDVILLCSDGLYKSLDDHQIMALLTDNKVSSRVSARRLVDMALTQAVRGQDNTTVIVIHYTGEGEGGETDALL